MKNKKLIFLFILISFLFLNTGMAFSDTQTLLQKKISILIKGELSKQGWDVRLDENFNREWKLLNMDARLIESIDSAIQDTIKDTAYINKLISGYIPSQAKNVAKQILEKAFKKKELQNAMKEVIMRTYIRMFEQVIDEKLIDIFILIGKDMNQRYGEKIAREFINYISTLTQEQNFDILDQVFDKDILKEFKLHYDIAKLGVIGSISVLITFAIMRKVQIGFMKRIVSRLTPEVFSKAILKLISWVAWVSVIWDLTHVDANITRIGEWLGESKDVKGAVFDTLEQITYENAALFFQKAASDTALSFIKLYEGFINKEGVK